MGGNAIDQQFRWEQTPHQAFFYVPFRWSEDGFWVVTEATEEDWGEPQQTEGEQ